MILFSYSTASHVYKQAPDLTTQYGAQQSPIKLSGTASKPHQLAVAAAKKLDESSKPMLSATTEKKQAQTTTGAHEGSTQVHFVMSLICLTILIK